MRTEKESQKSKGKTQKPKVKAEAHRHWILNSCSLTTALCLLTCSSVTEQPGAQAFDSVVLPFDFCVLHFDLVVLP